MKSVTTITRSLAQTDLTAAFARLHHNIDQSARVDTNPLAFLVPDDPLQAGVAFHQLLTRMDDNLRLSNHEKALLPWLTTLRGMLRKLGVHHMQVEAELEAFRDTPGGVCDMLVTGGPAPSGILEVKVIANSSVIQPRERDLAQLGAYAHLAARNRDYREFWAALAYVELRQKKVHLFGFKNVRRLVFSTTELMAA